MAGLWSSQLLLGLRRDTMANFFDIGAIFVAVAATGAQLYQGKKAEKASKRVVEA